MLAALWLLGLFAAAPVFDSGHDEKRSPSYSFVDRLRDALILGIAIPLVLAAVHLLYPVTCWIALVACLAIATYRHPHVVPSEHPRVILSEHPRVILSEHPRVILSEVEGPQPWLFIAALAIVAWPPLVRPILDGDSLSYHLPNAASWVQSHSLWTTVTRYWWYPPASELFASGLYAVAGPFSVGWSGLAALALLGFRLFAWARREFEAPAWLADALAAATVTLLPLALQSGSLQNDVWLAAFFLETLWAIRHGTSSAAIRSIAVTALTKPYGWILACIAAGSQRARLMIWGAGILAIVLWAGRCLLLSSHATVPIASTWVSGTLGTSVLAHGVEGMLLFVRIAFSTSPFVLVSIAAAVFGIVYQRRDRALAFAGLLAAGFFFVMPFVYDNGTPQLATGASLRQASPAIAVGMLLLVPAALRARYIAYALLAASTIFGAWQILAIYWNDAPTRSALIVSTMVLGAVALVRRWRSPWPAVAAFAIAVIAATSLAPRTTATFYADASRVEGRSSGIYDWIVRTRPAAIGGWGLRLGAVNVLSPGTRTIDLAEDAPCVRARSNDVVLVAVAQSDRPREVNAQRLSAARACGRVLYDDGLAVAVIAGRTGRGSTAP